MSSIRKLKANEIDVKVKQVSGTGILLLLYKTARVDMDILDETYGAENWQSDYKEIKGNLYAGIGIKQNLDKDVWVWKWDCGIESRADTDGNEKKGEASDAFKRAGFKCGIGRELYTAPFMWISSDIIPVKSKGTGYEMQNRFEKFSVKSISYDQDGDIDKLEIVNSKNTVVYTYGMGKVKIEPAETKPVEQPVKLSEQCETEMWGCKTIPELDACGAKWAKTENRNSVAALYRDVKQDITDKSKATTEQIVGDSLPECCYGQANGQMDAHGC